MSCNKLINLVGSTFDTEGFEEAIKRRWSRLDNKGTTRCHIHGTLFTWNDNPEEGDEPCWQCHDEFETIITGEDDIYKESLSDPTKSN